MSQYAWSDPRAAVPNPSPAPTTPSPTMSRLVRSKVTKEFLAPDGCWTTDPSKAARFADQSLALEAIHKFNVSEVELYYLMGEQLNPEYDFTLSL